jgi:hypothetical protein
MHLVPFVTKKLPQLVRLMSATRRAEVAADFAERGTRGSE